MEGHAPHSFEYLPMYFGNKDAFLHYTCNAPGADVLVANSVDMLGDKFGCQNNREVLLMPRKVVGFDSDMDKSLLQLNLEIFLKNLGKE